MRRHRPIMLACPVVVVALMLLAAAGCGSNGSHVARLGSTPTTRQSSSSSRSRATSLQQSVQQALAATLAFSRCMRSHGVANFPDPDSHGEFPSFQLASGVSRQTASSAQHSCQHLLPSSGSGGTGSSNQRRELLTFARCMRSHGFPTFPDPTVSDGNIGINFTDTGIDPHSPQFQTAQITCRR